MRQFGIGALGDIAVGRQQRRGVLEIELRTRAKKFLEVFVTSFEAGFGHDLVHFGADPFHFGEADLVNFLRRLVCGCVPLDVIGIHRGAVRQRSGVGGLAARGQVTHDQKVVKLRERGQDGLLVRCHGPVLELHPIRFGNCGGHFRESLEHRAFQGIGEELRLHLIGHIAKCDFRRRHLRRQALFHQHNRLIHERGDMFKP
jgi:hypothetical protein